MPCIGKAIGIPFPTFGNGAPVIPYFLLLETGDFLLLESGDKMIL